MVTAARAGDHRALNTLLRRHRKRLYRICERHCDRPEDAADLFQETCVGIMRAIHGFRGDSSFLTWAYLVVRSQASRLRRRRKARPRIEASIDLDWPICEPSLSPDHVVSGSRLQARFVDLLEQLSPLDRQVLVLRDLEGCTAPEVARELGLSVSAVKSRLHRARRFVRTTLTAGGFARVPSCAEEPKTRQRRDARRRAKPVHQLFGTAA
ncbi:MAG: RNA polymerase sigma factor [Nannocystaceae bacterium]